MININILFLGASKRVSLIERFLKAADKLNIQLNILSCENELDFYPISTYAEILKGPTFKSKDFEPWLKSIIKNKKINIIIPNMDSATVALSKFTKNNNNYSHTWPVVSSYYNCKYMEDKILTAKFFKKYLIPTPSCSLNTFPKIAKYKFGYGSKKLQIIESQNDLDYFYKRFNKKDYLLQDFIFGQEVTVDAYVSPKKKLIGYVLRDRLEISDGEVMVCQTREPDNIENTIIRKILTIKGWIGCITIQYIKDFKGNLYFLEINPRFGGGVTC